MLDAKRVADLLFSECYHSDMDSPAIGAGAVILLSALFATTVIVGVVAFLTSLTGLTYSAAFLLLAVGWWFGIVVDYLRQELGLDPSMYDGAKAVAVNWVTIVGALLVLHIVLFAPVLSFELEHTAYILGIHVGLGVVVNTVNGLDWVTDPFAARQANEA